MYPEYNFPFLFFFQFLLASLPIWIDPFLSLIRKQTGRYAGLLVSTGDVVLAVIVFLF